MLPRLRSCAFPFVCCLWRRGCDDSSAAAEDPFRPLTPITVAPCALVPRMHVVAAAAAAAVLLTQEFLEAMTAYYYGDKPTISDEEFSLLKEELIWNGSKVGTPTWGQGACGLHSPHVPPLLWCQFVVVPSRLTAVQLCVQGWQGTLVACTAVALLSAFPPTCPTSPVLWSGCDWLHIPPPLPSILR
jgi:hypothetical protein